MLNNFYTLQRVSDEINNLLGMTVEQCFTQDKGVLMIEMVGRGKSSFIQINTDSRFPSVLVRRDFARARKNSKTLLKELQGQELHTSTMVNNDRAIRLGFSKNLLFLLMFGGAATNAVLTARDLTISESFRKAGAAPGNKLELPWKPAFGTDQITDSMTIEDFLKRYCDNPGRHYAVEYCTRKKIDPQALMKSLSPIELNDMQREYSDFMSDVDRSEKCYILERKDGTQMLSLIELSGYNIIGQPYSSVSKAVHERIKKTSKQVNTQPRIKQYRDRLKNRQQKLQRELQGVQRFEESQSRARKYKAWADLLMAHPAAAEKHDSEITIEISEDKEQTIKLDPKLNLIDNAERLYKKIRNNKQDQNERRKRRPVIEERMRECSNALAELDHIDREKDLDNFELKYARMLNIKPPKKKMTPEDRFKKFELGEGFVLYVGKNSANNDELTMKFARPNDLWFHARGSSGSHAVMPLEKNQRPPKYIMQKAAAVAAYYSKARKAKHVPVAYTYKKYVRKPKGANPGAVVINKEEVIMADPGLPNESNN